MEIGKPKIVTEEALDAALAYIKDKVGNNSMLIVEQTETTASINPGVLNRWGVVANLSIDFTPPHFKMLCSRVLHRVRLGRDTYHTFAAV